MDEVELASLKTERDLLRVENTRLWRQVERLTDSVTQLALPASHEPDVEGTETPNTLGVGATPAASKPPKPSFWDWVMGRPRPEKP